MQSLHDALNQRIAVDIATDVVTDYGAEVSSLLRRASRGYLWEEHVVPLQGAESLISAVATRADLAVGSCAGYSGGSRRVRLHRCEAPCLDGARDRDRSAPPQRGSAGGDDQDTAGSTAQHDCDEVVVFAREGSMMVQAVLAESGFRPSTQNAVTDEGSFIAYAAGAAL